MSKKTFLLFYFSTFLLFTLLLFHLLITPAWVTAEEVIAEEVSSDSNPQPEEERISLDLKNVDIVELLRILSLKTAKTIVPGKEVVGRITIFLNNITFSDALDIILLSQRLACEKKGDILYVMSDAEYKKTYGKDYLEPRKLQTFKLTYAKPANVFNALSQLKSDMGKIIADEASGTIIIMDIPEKLEAQEKIIKELDQPLETQVFDLNYAKATEAKAQLSTAITPGTGEVIVDERSAKVIISDLPKKMEKLGKLVKELDEQTRQVFIEADIIEVTLSDKFQRGIDWQKIFSEKNLLGLDSVGKFPLATSFFQKISVGTLAKDNYSTVLTFLDSYGDLKTISQPRIAVVNGQEANVMVGIRDAYITQTLSQAQTTTVTSEAVQFVDIGVKLKISPTINKEGFITMKIKPEVSSVKETITTSLGSRIPIVQTAEAETTVKVKDGSMIMIAGLIKEEKRDTIIGVPGLARIPLLGALFSNREKENKRTELIVFLTPYLTKGDTALSGTEPEKNIPRELMPEKLKKIVRKGSITQSLAEAHSRSEEVSSTVDTSTTLSASTSGVRKSSEHQEEVSPERRRSIKKPSVKEELFFRQARDYHRKGLELQKTGSFIEARSYYQKAIILAPDYAPAYNQLGILFEQEDSADKAEEMYLKAITVEPGYLPAYSNLALLNEARKNMLKAKQYWQKLASLGDPADPWTQKALEHLEKEPKNASTLPE